LTRALIADDDPVQRALLGGMLKQWEIDFVVAPDGAAAWELLGAEAKPTMAILDWMMPGIDGVELVRRIRQDAAHTNMYLILLTSCDRPEDVVMGLEAGADDYLVKPFRSDELRARVNTGIRTLGVRERLAGRVGDLELALSNVKEIRGLLPICTYCKKIQGSGEWEKLEIFITAHTHAKFSHGICPGCFETVATALDLK
jgi:sigma-B regulation protein RsbU (phosphoserine phosphatase)